MRPQLLPLAFLSVFVSSILVAAQQPTATTAPQRDAQAVALLVQSLAALSGTGPAVADSISTGILTYSDGPTGPITIKTKGAFLRHEMSLPDGPVVHIVANGVGTVAANNKRAALRPWQSQFQRPMHIFAASRLADFWQPNTCLIYVGLEQVQGKPAHHIRISTLPLDAMPPVIEDLISEFHVFLDAQSLLPIKTQHFDFSPDALQNRTMVETYFTDYRSVSGVLVPFHLTSFSQGQQVYDLALDQVQFNVGVADSDFQ